MWNIAVSCWCFEVLIINWCNMGRKSRAVRVPQISYQSSWFELLHFSINHSFFLFSFTHSFICVCVHSFTHSFVCSIINSLCLFVYSLISALIQLWFICRFIGFDKWYILLLQFNQLLINQICCPSCRSRKASFLVFGALVLFLIWSALKLYPYRRSSRKPSAEKTHAYSGKW